MNKKLRAALADSIRSHALPPLTEIRLGKFLTEIRKLLEERGESENYPTLKLFCDWVVHAKLSGKKAQKLLLEADEYWDAIIKAREQGTPSPDPKLLSDTFRNFISLQGFKNELRAFLATCGIATHHVLDKKSWLAFEDTYYRVVKECPLVYENKKQPLKHFDHVTLSIEPLQWNPAQLKYDPLTVHTGVKWTFFKGEEYIFDLLLTLGGRPALPYALDKPSGPPASP